ncbi:MAG: AraC family transcriptional regulator [bacterium]|nr:AraC family transcriptional regulator [bacterium]
MSNRITTPDIEPFGDLDLLADILADSHRGIVYDRRWYAGGWGLRFDGKESCGFYVVTSGELIVRVPKRRQHTLRAGDVALLAGEHVIATDEDARPLPFSLERVRSLAVDERAGELCMLCGAYLVDVPNHPVFSNLPPLILLRAGQRDPSIDALIGLLDHEFRAPAPGARTVAARYIDAMLVCILRHWIGSDGPSPQNWIRGLRDAVLSRALALIHNEYARAWTLDTLARAAGASRATLARNFVTAVGTTPMRFLTQRRLGVAKRLMERTTMTLDEIAGRVGYSSAFSLSKAFKREFGHSPGAFRPALTSGPS